MTGNKCHPKQEPFKRYIYEKNGLDQSPVPYRTEWPSKPSFKPRLAMLQEEIKYTLIEKTLKAVSISQWNKRDADIDDFLTNLIKKRAFGFGF